MFLLLASIRCQPVQKKEISTTLEKVWKRREKERLGGCRIRKRPSMHHPRRLWLLFSLGKQNQWFVTDFA
eukprot:g41236.t1